MIAAIILSLSGCQDKYMSKLKACMARAMKKCKVELARILGEKI